MSETHELIIEINRHEITGEWSLQWRPRKRGSSFVSVTPHLSKEQQDQIEESMTTVKKWAPDLAGSSASKHDVTAQIETAKKTGKELFAKLTEEASDLAQRLRDLPPGRLVFKFHRDCYAHPWELLHSGEGFLALSYPVLRRPSVDGAADTLPDKMKEPFPLPLRILGLSYSPRGRDTAAKEHWDEVEKALNEPLYKELVELQVPEGNELQDLLKHGRLSKRVDVLHILAHGTDPSEGVPLILLGKEYAGDELIGLLQGLLSDVRLVILASCESGKVVPGDILSAGELFLKAGVPAVIAMQYAISPHAAVQFVSGLYESSMSGDPLDKAMLIGRRRIHDMMSSSIEWAIPVLYTALEGEGLQLFRPLSPQDRQLRQAYLTLLRESEKSTKKYLPIRVRRIMPDFDTFSDGGTRSLELLERHRGICALSALFDDQVRTQDAITVLLSQDEETEGPVTILLGEPGSGKTGLLSELTRRLVEPNDKEKMSIEQMASDPRVHIPVLVPLNIVEAETQSYALERLVYTGMTETVVKCLPDGAQDTSPLQRRQLNLSPTLDTLKDLTPAQIARWLRDPAWRFIIMLDGLEEVPRDRRQETAKALRRLITSNSLHRRHRFIITSTCSAYEECSDYLGRLPEWQIVSVSEPDARQELRSIGRSPDEVSISLFRQPWVLTTLREMHEQGRTVRSYAGLLASRINQLLNLVPEIQLQFLETRARETLMRFALEMQGSRSLSIDDAFRLMREVRGERTYGLEKLCQYLVGTGLILVSVDGDPETVRFCDPYTHSILAALALDRALTEKGLEELASWVAMFEHTDTHLEIALILLAQLSEERVGQIVGELIKRLDKVERQWEDRLVLLELIVRCLQHRPEALDKELQQGLTRELTRCLVKQDVETRLEDMAPGCLRGAELNTGRLRFNYMHVRTVRLFGYFSDPRAFEPLRWLLTEEVWVHKGRRLARSSVRQAAAQSAYRLWKAGILSDLLDDDPDLSELRNLLEKWDGVQPESKERDRKHAFDDLMKLFRRKEPRWLDSLAAVSIAEIAGLPEHPEGARAIEALADAFPEAQGDKLWAIADGVASLGGTQKESKSLQKLTNKLIEALTRGRNGVRDAAAYALGQLQSPEAITPLAKVLKESDRPMGMVAHAARSLGQCGRYYPNHPKLEEARRALLQVIHKFHGKDWRREEAIRALGFVGDEDSAKELLQVIQTDRSKHNTITDIAIIALQQMLGREGAAWKLLEALTDPPASSAALSRLLRAFGQVADESMAEVFQAKTKNWPQGIRKEVAEDYEQVLRMMEPKERPPRFPGRILQVMAHYEKDKQLRGPDVFQVEQRLWELGYAKSLRYIRRRFTGDTERAVGAFQEIQEELQTTGRVDAWTWRILFSPDACQGQGGLYDIDPETGQPIELSETLEYRKPMMHMEIVRLAQSYLWDLGYARQLAWIDGWFGPATQSAVMRWQRENRREVTGRIEKEDWEALRSQWKSGNQQAIRPGRACKAE